MTIKTGIHELTASYLLKFPIGKITPFVQAGTGALIFNLQTLSALATGTTTHTAAPIGVVLHF